MKKIFKYLFIAIIACFATTGCSQDNMVDINIVVTNYPNEFITSKLYAEYAIIESTYPDGVDIDDYKISKKQKKAFAKEDLFIYNGLIEKERNLALDFLSINKNLKIIDTAYVLETDYSPEELWLNPSSLLMMAQNVKLGLQEYVTNSLIIDEIEKNYDSLKVELSELDANYRLTFDNTADKTIVVDNSALKFLEKFNLEVICVDADASEKTISEVEELINDGVIDYIYTFVGEEKSEHSKSLLSKYSNLKVVELHKLNNLSDEERAENEDYISIMTDNLELLKQELYQ